MTNSVILPQLAWHDPRELELPVPDGWQIEVSNIAGGDRPEMTDTQIKHSLTNLIGSPPIREIARGKKEVVIIFDDFSRITRVFKIVPYILEELAEAGTPDSNIRFIAANGTHGAMDRSQFAQKLGESVMGRFAVYNHNPFFNCTYVGTTSRGTEVHINSEYIQCDFRIAIGSIIPHPFAVFSGGCKMILPGIASLNTIVHNHDIPRNDMERTDHDINPVHLDMDEAADLAGLDVNVDCILNRWGDTVEIFAGDPKQSHTAGVEAAKSHYLAKRVMNKDIVIVNTYARATEYTSGLSATFPSVKQDGGDVVLVCNSPLGQAQHYILGPCGKLIESMRNIKTPIASHVNHVIVYTEYPELSSLQYFEDSPKVMMMTDWKDVLQTLQDIHSENASVAVYPNADIQRFEDN